MTAHDHDHDLISALAEGRLSQPDAAAAESSIATCAECAADLAAHRLALHAIAAAPRPGLSMAESADLRRAVERALGKTPEPAPTATRRPWLGLVAAGAVVVVLLALAPLINLLSTDSSADVAVATTMASRDELAATAPAEAPTGDSAAVEEAPLAESQTDAAGQPADGEPLPQSFLYFRSVEPLDEFLADVSEGIGPGGAADRRVLTDDEVEYYGERFAASLETEVPMCPSASALEAVPGGTGVITVGTADLADLQLVIVVVIDGSDTHHVLALDATTCEVLGQSAG